MPSADVILQLQNQATPQITTAIGSLRQLAQELGRSQQSVTATVGALRQAAQTAGASETAFLELAGAMSRQALAAGDAARADEILANANRGLNVATGQAATETDQLAAAQGRASQQTGGLGGGFSRMLGPIVSVTAAIRVLKAGLDLAEEGESGLKIERAFKSLADQANSSGDAILNALRKASGGEISDLNLKLDANKGLLLGAANSAQTFGDIMTIARDRAAAMGLTTEQAFDNITTGIGRESPRILDNLGIIVDLDDAHKAYAASVGKSVDQLSKQERIQALANEVIRQGKASLDPTTQAANDASNGFAQLGTEVTNAKNRLAEFLALGFQPAAQATAQVMRGEFAPAVNDFNAAMAQSVGFTAQQSEQLATGQNAQQRYNQAVADYFGVQVPANDVTNAGTTATFRSADADDRKAAALAGRSAATRQLTADELALQNATALADQRKGEQTGTDLTAKQFDAFSKLQRQRNNEIADEKAAADKKAAAEAKRDADKAAADAKRLQDAQNSLRLAQATTTSAKIAELQRQAAAATDPVERVRLQTQIVQAQQQAEKEKNKEARAHTSELTKQLNLNERIYDSQNKQLKAQLDARAAIIQDRQQRREEDTQLRTANNIIARLQGRGDVRALDFLGRAQDRADLIDIQRQQRALDISEKQSTAGAQVINGRIYQSQGGRGNTVTQPATAAATSGAPNLTAPTTNGTMTVIVQIDGKTAWQGMASYAWAEMNSAIQHARLSQGS